MAGSTLLIPERHHLISKDGESGCALGMAGKACGLRMRTLSCRILGIRIPSQDDYTSIERRWPWLMRVFNETLPCGCEPEEDSDDFEDAIVHIFDEHVCMNDEHWTLEQLVDWVRSVEPAEEEQPSKEQAPYLEAMEHA